VITPPGGVCEVVCNFVTFVSPAQNIMTFNKCSIQGKPYGDPVDQYGNPMDVTNVSGSQTRVHWSHYHTPQLISTSLSVVL